MGVSNEFIKCQLFDPVFRPWLNTLVVLLGVHFLIGKSLCLCKVNYLMGKQVRRKKTLHEYVDPSKHERLYIGERSIAHLTPAASQSS